MSKEFVRAVAILSVVYVVAPPQFCSGNLEQPWAVKYLIDLGLLLKDGVPAAGIPKADPLPLSVQFTVDNEIFSGTVAVDGQLSGFSNYVVSNATLNPNLFVDLDLIFLSTIFTGTYDLDATLYKGIVPMSGSGPIRIESSYLRMTANGTLVGKNQMLLLKDFDFEIKQINFVEVSVEGLLKDYGLDAVLEPALRNTLNTGIKLFIPDMEDAVNQFVQTNGNNILRNVTLAKILEIIKNLMGVGDTVQISIKSKHALKRELHLSGEAIQKLWELFPIRNKN